MPLTAWPLVTSARQVSIGPPARSARSAVCSKPSWSMSAASTAAPSEAYPSANARPFPLPAPVTTATLPSSRSITLLLGAASDGRQRRSSTQAGNHRPSMGVAPGGAALTGSQVPERAQAAVATKSVPLPKRPLQLRRKAFQNPGRVEKWPAIIPSARADEVAGARAHWQVRLNRVVGVVPADQLVDLAE